MGGGEAGDSMERIVPLEKPRINVLIRLATWFTLPYTYAIISPYPTEE
jgi:hypothetical protein